MPTVPTTVLPDPEGRRGAEPASPSGLQRVQLRTLALMENRSLTSIREKVAKVATVQR
ncbi:hypothetical protein MTBUT4_90141 [Magnetospirillum sp. UT-4]|nr:hypothetical protein MTBUT4_90141 [Magnetospirillum sp. UT-4]